MEYVHNILVVVRRKLEEMVQRLNRNKVYSEVYREQGETPFLDLELFRTEADIHIQRKILAILNPPQTQKMVAYNDDPLFGHSSPH